MPTPAETLFSETHGRTMRAWSTVSIFRQVVQAGFATAMQVKTRESEALYDQMISGPDYMKLVTNIEGFRKAMPKEKFVELGVKQSAETASNSLDAATVLFGHSMVDGAAFDFCRVTALHAPQDWESDLLSKHVPLSLVRQRPFEEIRAVKLEGLLADLEMKSLEDNIRPPSRPLPTGARLVANAWLCFRPLPN